MESYDVKIVECGNVIEIYKYNTPIISGYKNKIVKEPREQTEQVKQENLQRSIKRSKRKISIKKSLELRRIYIRKTVRSPPKQNILI